jgi:hypothetical protein
MQKLQDMIDTVMGNINSKPMPQPKDPSTLERERAFAERARQLQMLREVRLRAQSKREVSELQARRRVCLEP